MKNLQATFWIVFCLLMYCGCTKPPHIHAGGSADEWSVIAKKVWLKDTISSTYIRALDLEKVVGFGFLYPGGMQSSYFAYEADADDALDALSRLAVPLHGTAGDVGYHKVSVPEWQGMRELIQDNERFEASYFWDVDPTSFDIYASAKTEHHLLMISRDHRHIIHRIMGQS